ncbi:NAD(P)-dependent alcohol dehydrogenase [uncultured Maribacter sp.]|uniref:NAD(P)-dependent alcohol dehydrogenase n=1 Tax=uncultured Maribacter sp. TaxID=431308 RepID=UPI00261C58EC|nr:NAD(P)-dependent alcohol dehydrogenase [uncultured Maribacter sp.]
MSKKQITFFRSSGLFKPKNKVLGADFSGIVQELGPDITNFNGNRVFGEMLGEGAFAQYTCAPEHVCGLMPEGTTYNDMACAPLAGLTALQSLFTYGKLKKGETVLINGSSGGVGHFAVQIAKVYGAHITAICSNKNIDFVKSIGADKVVAYDKVNIHQHNGKYDLVLDTNGNLKFSDYKRMGKRGIMVGFTTMKHMFSVLINAGFSKFPLTQFTAKANYNDLNTLANLIEKGGIKPHIEKTYSYSQIPEAIKYIESMRTRGKVVMTWEK